MPMFPKEPLTRYGFLEWRVVLLDLTNALSSFIRVMNHLFFDLLDQRVVIFLDNILTYSEDVTIHFEFLKKVLDRL